MSILLGISLHYFHGKSISGHLCSTKWSFPKSSVKSDGQGVPWWSSGEAFPFQCNLQCRLESWSGSQDPICFLAIKPKHKTETIL